MDFLPSTSRSLLLSVFVHSVYFYFSLDPLRCANEENGCRSAYSLMNVNAPLIHLTYTVHSLRIAYNSKQNLKFKSMELLKSFRILMTQKRTFFPAIFSRCQLKNEKKTTTYILSGHINLYSATVTNEWCVMKQSMVGHPLNVKHDLMLLPCCVLCVCTYNMCACFWMNRIRANKTGFPISIYRHIFEPYNLRV